MVAVKPLPTVMTLPPESVRLLPPLWAMMSLLTLNVRSAAVRPAVLMKTVLPAVPPKMAELPLVHAAPVKLASVVF